MGRGGRSSVGLPSGASIFTCPFVSAVQLFGSQLLANCTSSTILTLPHLLVSAWRGVARNYENYFPRETCLVDDRKVDHLRETYIKSDCFHLIKSKSTLNIKVH